MIDIPLEGVIAEQHRVNAPATFTVGVSTDPVLMEQRCRQPCIWNSLQIEQQGHHPAQGRFGW